MIMKVTKLRSIISFWIGLLIAAIIVTYMSGFFSKFSGFTENATRNGLYSFLVLWGIIETVKLMKKFKK